MKMTLAAVLLLLRACVPSIPARAGTFAAAQEIPPGQEVPAGQTKTPRAAAPASDVTAPAESGVGREDAYYYFMVGHLDEQNYEASNGSEGPDSAIEAYKKALE